MLILDEFNKAAISGKVNISRQTGKITITNAGKDFIKKPEFRIAAAKDYEAAIRNMEQPTVPSLVSVSKSAFPHRSLVHAVPWLSRRSVPTNGLSRAKAKQDHKKTTKR